MERITCKCNWSQISLGVQEANEIKFMLDSLQNCNLCFHHNEFSGYWTMRISTTSAAFATVLDKQHSHMLIFDALIFWSGKHIFDMPWFKLSLSFSQVLSLALDLLASLLCITSSPRLPLLCENFLCPCREAIHCPNLVELQLLLMVVFSYWFELLVHLLDSRARQIKKALDWE